MRQLRILIVAIIVLVLPLPTQAKCSKRDPSAPASIPCSGNEKSCREWKHFRNAHPFPYQTIGISTSEDGDSVIVISEPPPIAHGNEVVKLVATVFDGYSPVIDHLRYPMGLDGWLEDLVVRVNMGKGTTISVPTASGSSTEVQQGLANRLQYLYSVLFGPSDEFYVDTIDGSDALKQVKLTELKEAAAHNVGMVATTNHKWRPLETPESPAVSWDQMERTTKVANFVDESNLVVMLLIPPNTDVGTIRREFRRFAVATDYLVGALRPKKGGVALIGRDRIIPLDVLPPLRFETVASLARSLGRPLAQSYERQRIFAGKVRSGEHSEWDWAPIYLSPQLQDSEFGTLLNLADQQLKSWSERGEIRYATFNYPTPTNFPFGESTATDWFFKRTLSSSLIFNWNTAGFSTAVDQPAGRVLSAYSTSALPVSYILPQEEASSPLMRNLLTALKIDSKREERIATDGSNKGSKYFAEIGDPILARVVQNVFLYQILSETKPFQSVAAPAAAESKRSQAVTKILIDEATRWLREATGPDATSRSTLAKLVRQSGMPVPKLAELLAAPDLNTRAIVRAQSTMDLQRIGFNRLIESSDLIEAEYELVYERAKAEFLKDCSDRNGTISHVTKEGNSYIECSYVTRSGTAATSRGRYDANLARVTAEVESIHAQIDKTKADYKSAERAFETMVKEREAGERVADDLRTRASFVEDLDSVLQRVLKATSAAASSSSIQTPSVVLSCNAEDLTSVGGHNIDPLPWLAKQGSAHAAPALRTIESRPTVLVPKESLGNSTQIARSVVQHETHLDTPARPITDVLGVGTAKKGSFLEQLRTRPLIPVDSGLMSRAQLCRCDIYVERGATGDTATIVSLKPPPTTESVFGSSRLIERLAEKGSSSRVLFAGFSEEQASTFSQSAIRQARSARPREAGFLADSIRNAKELFRNALDTSSEILKLRSNSGKLATVALDSPAASRIRLAELLAERPRWADAQVTRGSADKASPLIEVVFPPQGRTSDLQSMTVFAYDGKQQAINKPELRNAAQASVRALSTTDPIIDAAVKHLAEQIHRDSSVQEVKFFLKGVGTEIKAQLRTVPGSPDAIEVIIGE